MILTAAKGLASYRKPEGKKWSVFYSKKVKFVASEVSNEDESEIRSKVKKVVDAFAADATHMTQNLIGHRKWSPWLKRFGYG